MCDGQEACCVMLCTWGQSWRTEEALPLDLSAVGPRGVGIALRGQRLREGRVGHAAGLEDGGGDISIEPQFAIRIPKWKYAGSTRVSTCPQVEYVVAQKICIFSMPKQLKNIWSSKEG